jgi:hypothetical protein
MYSYLAWQRKFANFCFGWKGPGPKSSIIHPYSFAYMLAMFRGLLFQLRYTKVRVVQSEQQSGGKEVNNLEIIAEEDICAGHFPSFHLVHSSQSYTYLIIM